MKYKVGDKVKVRSDLKAYEIYGSNMLTKSMEKFVGKTVTISGVGITSYAIEEMEVAYWTDEMLEQVEEMSAEEAIRTFGEVCKDTNCWHCPIKEIDREHSCTDIKISHPEEVVKILKQWKADHEKKPIETENVIYIVVMDEKRNVVYEEKTNEAVITATMKEETLKKYCVEHDGKYYAIAERRCVVKE